LSSLTSLQNGRYIVLKKLGEGGKGVVYKARDTVLNRVVAIKVLKTAVAGEESYSRFMREAQSIGKLNHPNIVSIHDIGKEDDKQFLVIEFVDGMSLRELMSTYPEGKCDIQTVLRIGMNVCGALQYAHAQSILHRDIKPENVMLTREETAKLNDFGLAKMLGQPGLTQEGIIVGTVAYVAPEIALGRGADARSDLYSFGAVLYEAVVGKPPFVGEDAVKVIFSHIHDYPVYPSKLNPKVPQALADCIMKLLEKEPEKRYQSAADLLKVLREVAEEYVREVLVSPQKPSVVVPSPRPLAGREVQLIDRVEELALLREAVDRAIRGEGGVVFLCGEAGIGKTRLTRELGAYARLRGMQVLYGRCPALFRMDGVPPYVLWSEVIKDYLQSCAPEQLYKVIGYYPGELFKLVPEIGQKLRVISESLPISPMHGRDRLFEAVSQFVTNISKEAPLLVILDDLQWTDQTSLLLLHYLARGVYRESLLLLGAYRDTDIDEKHQLTPVLTELNRERLLQSAQLKRMSFDDTSEMIRRILEQDEVPTEFCKLVYDKTRGNPFFAEEVIKSLKEEEVICREENKWRIKDVSSIEFPKTVKSVIKARIGRLDDECQNALTLASFIGNDFTCEALCAVTGMEENRTLDLIEKLLKTGLVKHRVIRGEDVCSFTDIIVRDIAYEEVSPFRRKKLHNVVGCALEKVYAKKIDEHYGELALHFLESGDKDKALDYFLKAGEKAAKIYAHSETASYFQSALRLLVEREGELSQKARVLESLGDVKSFVGEFEAGMKYWDEALSLLDQLGEKEKISRLNRKMALILYEKGDLARFKEFVDKALKILETQPESNELAITYGYISGGLWLSGDLAEALLWAEKARALAEKLRNSEAIATSYGFFGTISNSMGDLEKGIECLEKALKIALDNGYIEIALMAYNNLGVWLPAEKNERRLEILEKGYEHARKVGHVPFLSWLGSNLANMYIGMGNMGKAVLLAEESVAVDRKIGNLIHLPMSLGLLGSILQMLGEWDKSEQYLRERFSLSQKLGDIQSVAGGYGSLGLLHFDKGEFAEAKEFFEKAYEVCEKAGAKSAQMVYSRWLASTLIEQGEIEKACSLLDKSYEYAMKAKNRAMVAWTDVRKGMMFRAQKKWEESIAHFEKSMQELEALGERHWQVYGFAKYLLYEYARMYLERNEEGDRQKAHTLLNQALEIFQKLGAKKDIEKVLAKKKLLTA